MESNDESDDGGLKVIPIMKKVVGKNPGSSPEQRSGIQDVDYVQRHGKGPLIEKRDKMRKNRPNMEEQGSIEPVINSYNSQIPQKNEAPERGLS